MLGEAHIKDWESPKPFFDGTNCVFVSLQLPMCIVKHDPEVYWSCGSYEAVVSNTAIQINYKLILTLSYTIYGTNLFENPFKIEVFF